MIPEVVTDTIGNKNNYGLYTTIQSRRTQNPFTGKINEKIIKSTPNGDIVNGHYLNRSVIQSTYTPDSVRINTKYGDPRGRTPKDLNTFLSRFNEAMFRSDSKIQPLDKKKFQQGGKVEETNQEQLILDFALRYMKGLGVDESELKNGIPDEYIPEITEAFNAVANSTEFWLAYEEDPEATMQDYLASREDLSEEQAVFAKKGAKLKQLKSKQKRCKCGCKMTSQKEGGKLVSKCACGCDTKKK